LSFLATFAKEVQRQNEDEDENSPKDAGNDNANELAFR
jgi:hypothetical protein